MGNKRSFDLLLWLCPVTLWVFGLFGLWSLSRGPSYPLVLVQRQLTAGLIGLVLAVAVSRLRWNTVTRFLPLATGLTFALLGLVLFAGQNINGATRWLVIPGVGLSLQPSELAKIMAVLSSAWIWSETKQLKSKLLGVGALLLVLGGLVFMQPDLGTSCIVLANTLVVSVLGGLSIWILLGVLGFVLFLAPWMMNEYQWQRVTTLLNPAQDPSGAGWNLEQSKIAIGSGGLSGKGAFRGLQGPLDFLPEAHSDFLYSVLCEEYGLLGASLVIGVSAVLSLRLMYLSGRAQGLGPKLCLAGLGSNFAIHSLLNIGMTTGVAPVTGSPLPFVSFGGTALVVNLVVIGLAQSLLEVRRFEGLGVEDG